MGLRGLRSFRRSRREPSGLVVWRARHSTSSKWFSTCLCRTRRIRALLKWVSAKKDAALSILSLQLKQPPPPDDGDEIVAELLRRVRGENAKTAEAPKPIAGPRL